MSLFSIINEAKSLAAYDLANIAFAALIDEALDNEWYQLIWESNENHPNQWRHYDQLNTYYDLFTISDGLRRACIPAPILRHNVAKALMSLSKEEDKHTSNRVFVVANWQNVGEKIRRLWDKLINNYPNVIDLAHKYLGCRFCKFFAPGTPINCFPHPEGLKGSQSCVDFVFDFDLEKQSESVKKILKYEQEQKQRLRQSKFHKELELWQRIQARAKEKIEELTLRIKEFKSDIEVLEQLERQAFQPTPVFDDYRYHYTGIEGSYASPDSEFIWGCNPKAKGYPVVAYVGKFPVYGAVTTWPRHSNLKAGWMAKYNIHIDDFIFTIKFVDENESLDDRYFEGSRNPVGRGILQRFSSFLQQEKEKEIERLTGMMQFSEEKIKEWKEHKAMPRPWYIDFE